MHRNMRNMQALMVVILLSFLFTACDGGGGGDSGPAPPLEPQPQPASLSSASVSTIFRGSSLGLNTIGSGDIGGSATPRALTKARAEDLVPSTARFYNALRTRRTILGMPRAVEPCADGGTVDVTETATELTAVFANCRIRTDEDRDGIAEAEFVFQNLTVALSIQSTTVCGDEAVPAAFTLALNGLVSAKIDEDDNRILDEDVSINFGGFTLAVVGSAFDPRSCVPTNIRLSEFGTLAVTNNLAADDTSTLTIASGAPVIVAVQKVPGGANVSVNGSYALQSACFTGTLTVETTETLFIPIADEITECPTAGKIRVTGDQRGTITFTATGGVEIDNGSDGTVDKTFRDCEEAEVCT